LKKLERACETLGADALVADVCAVAAALMNKAARIAPPDTNLLIPITSETDITERTEW
jgi:alpha-D-ribose 1-methylphosphonate 5-triphosphate synthase subunit PhnG